MIKKIIPHIFTSLNLFLGCVACYFAFSHQFNAALLFVFLGIIFDFFDGFFARLLGVESFFGVELDSLADLITSGFVPAVVMYQLFLLSGVKTIDFSFSVFHDFSIVFTFAPLASIAFIITIGSAIRLARFNLIKEPLPYFRGLPTPANALMIMGLPLLLRHPNMIEYQFVLLHPISLIFVCLFSVLLMNIDWKMFKIKPTATMGELLFPILLLIGTTVLFLVYGLAAISGVILLYMGLSAIKFLA